MFISIEITTILGVGVVIIRYKANLSSAKLDWTSQLELSLAKVLDIRGKYSDIFKNKFSEELIKTLHKIYNYRNEFNDLKWKSLHMETHVHFTDCYYL